MHITLVGMSNIGKTFWAHRLAAETGFERIDCDGLIEQQLGSELTRLGYKGIAGVAKWMGQPYEPQYAETSRKFVALEKDVMKKSIAQLQARPARPLVLDTSGSVIYAGDDILEPLKALTKVIYLEASRDHVSELLARYVSDPKPLVWGDAYAPRAGENTDEALKRCYPELLESRARLYTKMAAVTIPFAQHRKSGDHLDVITRHIQ